MIIDGVIIDGIAVNWMAADSMAAGYIAASSKATSGRAAGVTAVSGRATDCNCGSVMLVTSAWLINPQLTYWHIDVCIVPGVSGKAPLCVAWPG